MITIKRCAELAAFAALASAGCTRVNPLFCNVVDECSGGRLCDTVSHECVLVPDAAFVGNCMESIDCPVDAPICSASDMCGLCEQGSRGDAACAERDPLRPTCRGDGECVACITSADCTGADAPFCNERKGTCRGCIHHDECSSEVCQRQVGDCAAPAGIIYVDNGTGTDGPTCGAQASPCATIAGVEGGLSRIGGGALILRVRAGSQAYPEAVAIDGVSLVVVAAGASITPVVPDAPALVVSGGANVSVDGLRVQGASGNANADGVRCTDAGTVLRLTDMVITANDAVGLETDAACDVFLANSTVSNNRGGGVVVLGSAFEIYNNMIVDNGVTGTSAVGGINLNQTGDVSDWRFEFNTVANNAKSSNAVAAGLHCSAATNLGIKNNIVVGNTPSGQIGGACTSSWSNVEGGATGDGNIDMTPLFVGGGDYHLTTGSPGIDVAEPNATLTVDIDGEDRPDGDGFDMGADEWIPAQ